MYIFEFLLAYSFARILHVVALIPFGILPLVCAHENRLVKPAIDPNHELRPISHRDASLASFWKRSESCGDVTQLRLRDFEHLFWGNPSGNASEFTFANITLSTSEHEKVILLDTFGGLLVSAECSDSVTLKFRDKAALQYANNSWDWVNEPQIRSFYLVTEPGSCSNSSERQIYHINSTTTDESEFSIHLQGDELHWDQFGNALAIEYGTISNSSLGRRGISLDISKTEDVKIPLQVDMNKKILEQSKSDYGLDIDCTDCGIGGAVAFTMRLVVVPLKAKINEISVSMVPQDIKASMNVKVVGRGKIPVQITYAPHLTTIPLGPLGFSIPNIITLGAVATADFGLGLANWKGDATVELGASASLPADSLMKVDLVNQKKFESKGWEPKLTVEKPTISGKCSFDISTFIQYGIGLEASLFNQGFQAGLRAKLPEIIHGVAASSDTDICQKEHKNGVAFQSKIGAQIEFTAGSKGILEVSYPLKRNVDSNRRGNLAVAVTKELWRKYLPLYPEQCITTS
ncbi:hypothetical protein BCR34DRAFT_49730 [Clohesyomyces aquaticus]|uniref:Uncharacterized protein n=1 Tax=Clohesyomyces aquaticus TaxID=1231657 RepID=A0A1Y1Z4A2_9PLEO|nr:hypothetical protein BCR34DRAFT_49730 [Clohesyomyces aquaticus]